MPLFLIERNFAEQLGLETEGLKEIEDYNSEHNLNWLFSFLSADKRKSYCLYEATNADDIRKHAEDLGVPADEIVEVSEVNPKLWGSGESVTGHAAG